MPNISDVIGDRDRQLMASGPTPTFHFQHIPTPAPPISMAQYRQEMFSNINIASMQAMGLAQAQSMNINNPYAGNMGATRGMAPPWMMTPAPMGVFRPAPPTPPPALTATPGVTNQFTNPADLATQYELMRTGMFADPGSASQNYGRMKLHQFGQQYGAGIGTALGVGASFIPGVGPMGGSMIGSLGQMAMENLNNIPGVGAALRWGIGAMNQNVAEQLAWTGGAQHGTLGRVALGPGEAGLGGRGMNTQAAMRLGRQMRQMSLETGRPDEAGALNQTDMMNLLRTAGDTGFLESATNVDQIAKTVGGLMKLVGSLAKITGDPDFRNNLRELGQMRTMGLATDQGVNALQNMNTWARMAGMTREQAMAEGGIPGAQRAVAAGLTGGVGMLAGTHAQGQARMLRGTFSETQQALFGDIGQTLAEGQIGFAAGVMPYLAPSLLSAGAGGKVGLDQEKISKLLKGGALDMGEIAGRGAMNLQEVARQAAESRAKAEGREVRASDVPDEMLRIQARMREFQSDLFQKLGPEKSEFLRYQLFQGLQKNQGIGQFAAATAMAGGNMDEAQILLQKWTDPNYAKRMQGFQVQEQERVQTERYQEAQGRIGEMTDRAETSRSWFRRTWRDVKEWWQEPMKMSARDLEKADDELRRIQRESDEARGISRLRPVGPMTYATERVGKMVREAVKAGKWRDPGLVRNRREGDEALSEEEARAAGQLLGESEGGVSSWLVGEAGGTAEVETAAGRAAHIFGGHFWSSMTTGVSTVEYMRTHSKALIRDRRRALAAADRTSRVVEKLADATGSQLAASSKSVMQSLAGAGGKSPPAQTMAAIRNRVLAKAGQAGRDGRGATVDDMRNEAARALADSTGMTLGQATERINAERDMWDPWLTQQVMRGPDKDAAKAVQNAVDIATGIKAFNIPESEEGIKKAEERVAQELGEAGVFIGKTVTQFGDESGLSEPTVEYKFGEAERGAFQMFFKTAADVGAGFGEGEAGEGKAQMLSLLVAREQQEAEAGSEAKAGGALQQLIASDQSGKTEEIINDLRKKIASGSKEQRQVLSQAAGLFTDFQGSGEDILKQMTEAERLAAANDPRAKKGAKSWYELAAINEAIQQKQGKAPEAGPAPEGKPGETPGIATESAVVDRFDKAVRDFGAMIAEARGMP